MESSLNVLVGTVGVAITRGGNLGRFPSKYLLGAGNLGGDLIPATPNRFLSDASFI